MTASGKEITAGVAGVARMESSSVNKTIVPTRAPLPITRSQTFFVFST